MPTLHGVNASPFVRKVRVALAEKGIQYDLVPVLPFGVSDEFRAISPLGKIPVYQEGEFTLPDSSCILLYLERTYPEPRLLPEDPRELGRALFLEEYGDTRLTEVLLPAFANRIVRAKIFKQEADEAEVKAALDAAPSVFDYLEQQLEGREFLAGGQFSVADIGMASPFVNFAHAGEGPDAARWPKLAAWLDRVLSRPSFKACVEEEKASLAALG